MFEINDTLYGALLMIWSLESQYIDIIVLSLKVSLTALIISCMISLPLASYLSIKNFFGKSLIIIILNSFMALPPVVVGLFLYLLLSWQGVLSSYEILYTPTAMIIAQVIIIFPIVTSLSHEIFFQNWKQYKDQFRSLNIPFFGIIKILTIHSYFLLITVLLSAFGRAISEVGAVMIVGGNIDHFTRVMTTAISLETRMGNLEYAMALGIILILLTMIIYSLVYIFNLKRR